MKEIKTAPHNEPWLVIFLSLFLILLVFFILLNSLATVEEKKTRKALTSVAAAFRSVADAEARTQLLISDLGPTPDAQDVLEALEQLWVASIPITRVEKLTKGQVMQMTIPVNELFLGGKAVLRSDREALFDRTALVLALKGQAGVTDLQVVFGTMPGVQMLSNSDGRLAVERASTLAAALVDHGSPADRLSIGLREGDPKAVRLRFEIRDAARAQVTFKKDGAT
jgi:flagellar motor protein MotB